MIWKLTECKESIKIQPAFLYNNYKTEIINRLKILVDGKCTRYGHVKKDSIIEDTIETDEGRVILSSLNGDVSYNVTFKAYVCDPVIGSIIRGKVIDFNKFALVFEFNYNFKDIEYKVIKALIPKNFVEVKSDVDLSTVKLGEEYDIEVIKKKYKIDENKIIIIGRICCNKNNNNIIVNEEEYDEDINVDDDFFVDAPIIDEEENDDDIDEDDDDDDDDVNEEENNDFSSDNEI